MEEVYEFLKKCGTYYLATVEGDQPRVRAFGTIDLFEGKLYIQTGKVKEVSKRKCISLTTAIPRYLPWKTARLFFPLSQRSPGR